MITETYRITDDSEVTLTAYLADVSNEMPETRNRPAMLVLPGGAYKFCSDREAEPVALTYLALGFNAFVLRYSLNEKAEFPTPLNDARAALSFIRKSCENFHINPQKVAVCGFSAGGHLAAALSAMSEEKPNACVLGYPCILESIGSILAKPIPSVEKYVTPQTPPTFIFAASDDSTVPIENSLQYALALSRNDVPHEMHIFSEGEHGFSLANELVCGSEWLEKCKPCSYWVNRSAEWLKFTFNKSAEA